MTRPAVDARAALVRAVVSVVVSAVVSVVVLGGCGGDDASGGWPDVELVAASDGGVTSSRDVVGSDVTIVSLWATWCGPCKEELPMLQEMSDDGATVVGVNIGDDPPDVASFLDDYGVDFANYIDGDGVLMSALDVASVPVTLILRDGVVVWRSSGAVVRSDIETQLEALSA